MKFLKYFESNEESNLFWKINTGEYIEKVYNDEFKSSWMIENFLEFTNNELLEIRKYFPNILERKSGGYITNQLTFKNFYLTKMEDEWYYIYLDDYNIYRCDQNDGFIACLEYLKNKGDI